MTPAVEKKIKQQLDKIEAEQALLRAELAGLEAQERALRAALVQDEEEEEEEEEAAAAPAPPAPATPGLEESTVEDLLSVVEAAVDLQEEEQQRTRSMGGLRSLVDSLQGELRQAQQAQAYLGGQLEAALERAARQEQLLAAWEAAAQAVAPAAPTREDAQHQLAQLLPPEPPFDSHRWAQEAAAEERRELALAKAAPAPAAKPRRRRGRRAA